MALVIKDRVRQTSTTAGTGTITLSGSVTGYQDFTVIGTGNTTYYTIADQSGSNWEVGLGTYTAPNQLARTTVYESSNGNALVNFGSNIKDVFVTLPAEGFASPPAIGGTTPNTITGTTITANTTIDLPAVVNTGSTTGVLQMVDGGDGNDYLNIYTDDGSGISTALQVGLPGGVFAGGTSSFGAFTANYGSFTGDASTYSGYINLYGYSSGNPVQIQAAASTNNYILTLPTTTGSANQVLKTDGTGITSWTTIGSSPITYTGTTDPSAPTGTNTALYSKSFGGFATLAARNALNTSFGLQTALWSKNVQMWTPTNSTNGSFLGNLATGSGTHNAVTPTAGSTLYQTIRRSTYANVITTTNQLLGVTASYGACFRGSVAGQGGFFFYTRCGFDVWTNGGRFFAGAATSTAVVNSGDPSALNNTVGFCVDAADNGAISFLTRGTAATKASTGYTITSNKGYDLYIYCSPNSSQYTWMIVDINAGTSATGTATTNLPTNTTIGSPYVCASNAALTTATAINLGVNKIYVESDY